MKLGQWIGFLILILSLVILWELRQLMLLIFVASIFSTALNRPVGWLQSRGMKRSAASTVCIVSILSLLTLFGILIVPPFIQQFQELTELVPQGFDEFSDWLESIFERLPGELTQYLPTVNDLLAQLQPLASGLANNVFRLFSGFLNITGGVLVVLVFTIMFLVDPTPYRNRFIRFFPSFYRRRADEILTLCEVDLVAWIIGTLLNMVIVGAVSGIVLWILGVRLVLANALLTGLLEAIPNLGPVISTLLPTAIALLDSPWKALGVVIAYVLIQQLEQFLLVPVIMGQQVSLLPAVTLAAQIVFASFFGFLGLFLALPLVIIVRVLLREVLIKDVLDQWTIAPNPDWRSPQKTDLFEHTDASPTAFLNLSDFDFSTESPPPLNPFFSNTPSDCEPPELE
jgi:predicted PurR-regulated permease PerM